MSTYWSRRQAQLAAAIEKDEAKLKKRLTAYYSAEYSALDKEIAAYYQKYGVDNVIEYRRLLETLPDADKRLLIERMDDFAEKYPQYKSLLPVRESIYKLDRLEGLQYSVRLHQLNISAITNEEVAAHLKRQALRGANAATEAMGFGKNFYSERSDIVHKFVGTEWSNGKDFSTRIWENTDKLASYLNTDIAQGFARGESYEKLTQHLQQRFENVSQRDAYRLIYTEGTYVMNEASIAAFEEDFDYYKLSPVRDGKTCSVCVDVSRSTFEIKNRQPGVNFPPMHPYCRCRFEIVVIDRKKWLDDYVEKHQNDTARMEEVNRRFAEKLLNRFVDGRNADNIKGNILKSGTEVGIITLPGYENAVLPKEKFTEYALNPAKDPNKATAFREALGYTASNYQDLIDAIYAQLPKCKAVAKGDVGFGQRYEVRMRLKGPNGKTANIITAWIQDKQNGELRLTSVYVDKR